MSIVYYGTHKSGIVVGSNGEVWIPRGHTFPAHWTFGTVDKDGYKTVVCNYKRYKVHRLVAEVFLSNPECKPEVDHINRVKDDNRVENLRWATHSENNRNRSEYDRVESEGRTHWCDDRKAYDRENHRRWRSRYHSSDFRK